MNDWKDLKSTVNDVQPEKGFWKELCDKLVFELTRRDGGSDLFEFMAALQGTLMTHRKMRNLTPDLLHTPLLIMLVEFGKFVGEKIDPKDWKELFADGLQMALVESSKNQIKMVSERIREIREKPSASAGEMMYIKKLEWVEVDQDEIDGTSRPPGFKPKKIPMALVTWNHQNVVLVNKNLITQMMLIFGHVQGQEGVSMNSQQPLAALLPLASKLVDLDNWVHTNMTSYLRMAGLDAHRPVFTEKELADGPENSEPLRAHWAMFQLRVVGALKIALGLFEKNNRTRVTRNEPPVGQIWIFDSVFVFLPHLSTRIPLHVSYFGKHTRPSIHSFLNDVKPDEKPEYVIHDRPLTLEALDSFYQKQPEQERMNRPELLDTIRKFAQVLNEHALEKTKETPHISEGDQKPGMTSGEFLNYRLNGLFLPLF